MAGAIGPGDWVECIDASPDWWGETVPLVVGRIYRVLRLERDPDRERPPGTVEECGVILVGVRVGPKGDDSFSLGRFRPVYRPNVDIIESLKAPSPSRELEDA